MSIGIVLIMTVITSVSVIGSILAVRQVKKQLAEISDVLAEIRNGNGNRRVLAKTHELAAPLAYEINDIIQSYERKLAALCQTEETNKELMTSLSHDVRTPLTTLIGYLDAACKGTVSGKKQEDYMETARLKAYDLKEYIDVLFDWFKLNSNDFKIINVEIEIVELTRNILIDWIPIFEDKQIDYTIEIPEHPVQASLDADCYMRIMNNLIQNILTHSHADKILITMSCENQYVKLSLYDNGIGIDKEDLKHIFERLYKCDRGRTEKSSGLGLSIVHQLVKKMGGKITAESTPGKGSAFMLFLPLSNEKNLR